MAKSTNGLGQFSGKLGSVVFAVSNGQQSVRQYQPIVNNPKTALQNAQRAKGNLAGRISSFVPRTAIIGLGSNNRMRRGAFLQNILKKATVTVSGGDYTANVKRDEIIFSKGAVLPVFSLQTLGVNARQVSVSLLVPTGISPQLFAGAQGRIVVMVYDPNDNLVEVSTSLVNKPADINVAAVTTVYVNQPAGYRADAYLIPMSTEDGSAVTITSDMAHLADPNVAALLSANRNAVVFEYGHSVYLGTALFNPA